MNQMSMSTNQKRIKIDYGKLEERLKEDGFLQIEIEHIKTAIKNSSQRIIRSIKDFRN